MSPLQKLQLLVVRNELHPASLTDKARLFMGKRPIAAASFAMAMTMGGPSLADAVVPGSQDNEAVVSEVLSVPLKNDLEFDPGLAQMKRLEAARKSAQSETKVSMLPKPAR